MHLQRTALHNELHARPSMYFEAPAHVFHLAFLDQDNAARSIIRTLCDRHIALADPTQPQGEFPIGGARLKWERHTEFLTLTMVTLPAQGVAWPALPPVLAGVVETYSGLLINADQICVEAQSSWRGSVKAYGLSDPVGSSIGDQQAIVWSDLRLNENGLNRLLVLNHALDARRLGRMVRRLLEIETYRLMASLTLPIARSLQPDLTRFEQELVKLSDANAAVAGEGVKTLLANITRLSAQVTQMTARNRLRFSATEAYAELVFERITQLHEGRTEDCQRLGSFIGQRFRPTVRYCAATDRHLTSISHAVARLGDLLQARVQVEMEEQNGRILRNLSVRADTQIHIQRAVEGLSIIAISYYLFSLAHLFYEGLHTMGLDISPRSALLTGAPIVGVILAVVAYRIINVRRQER
ncbi:MAG TPA: DUF3422 domain-containing protein [Nevskiaceae bacterium]|nr:DUF3422 domain-containing protein [Nevskiaceae bacterium]